MRRPLLPALFLVAAACTSAAEVPPATTSPPSATSSPTTVPPPTTAAPSSATTTATSTTTTTTTTTTLPPARFSDRSGVAAPYGGGLVMFRGNLTRTWYGTGPMPTDPVQLWRYPESAMCSNSTVGGVTTQWCGTGWTGQPVVWERPDGITEVIFGAYDAKVHFVDAATGTDSRPPFPVGDLIKGSVSLDPDGFPLLYFGSRDNKLRILALDRDQPLELWSRDAYENAGIWNDDWDGNPAIADDIMFEGGENGFFYAFRLNRALDEEGLVVVDPVALIEFPAFTDELIAEVGRNQSIENSVALFDGHVYFANGAGRIVGLDLERIDDGAAPVVFDFWVGEDVDASIVIDGDGMLYVAAEQERFNARGLEVGQLLKLDPNDPEAPVVWSVAVPPRNGGDGGIWATPALGDGVLYVSTHPGELLAVDTATGEVAWRDEIGHHAWSSPVIVDDTLLVAVDCDAGGGLRAYDITVPRRPEVAWEMPFGPGCIESTPAVWNGRIYVGSRDGHFYAFGE